MSKAELSTPAPESRLTHLRYHHPTDWGWRELRPAPRWRDRLNTFVIGFAVAAWLGLVAAVWLHAL